MKRTEEKILKEIKMLLTELRHGIESKEESGLLDEIPEENTLEIKEGVWYRNRYTMELVYIRCSEKGEGYGFNKSGEWVGLNKDWSILDERQDWGEESLIVVAREMKEEAMKRGLFEGSRVVIIKGDKRGEISHDHINGAFRMCKENEVYSKSNNGNTYTVFYDGVWTIPVNLPFEVEELIHKLKYEM